MRLDLPTLYLMTVVVALTVGALFLLSWSRSRSETPLAIWGIAHIGGGLGSALLSLRGIIPDALSIGLANALLLSAYGLIWSGVRAFERRPPRYLSALAGGAAWLLVCLVPAFYASLTARVMLASALAGLFCTLCALELFRGRHEPLVSRWTGIVLLGAYAGLYWMRVPLAVLVPLPAGAQTRASPWLPILCFAGVLFTVAGAFVLIALTKERSEHEQRRAAETDPLTGLANRRAFVSRTQAHLSGGGPVALLLFDLDHFKAINDSFGHAVGDGVLVAFAHAAGAVLPGSGLLGRMGGEEFACLLPGLDARAAARIAERVRATIAGIALPAYPGLAISVSVGVAEATGRGRAEPAGIGADIDALLSRADGALYRAKRAGRDRVAVADPVLRRAA